VGNEGVGVSFKYSGRGLRKSNTLSDIAEAFRLPQRDFGLKNHPCLLSINELCRPYEEMMQS
jgi:hypothetical protein